jgi:aldehyde dehydrogenase (NAD+)
VSTTTLKPAARAARHDKLYIDGRWVKPASEVYEDVINPSTEEVLASVVVGTPADTDAAIAAARRAFDEGPWPRMDRRERARLMRAFYDAVARRKDDILKLTTDEVGLPSAQAIFQYSMPMAHFANFIELSERDPLVSLPIQLSPLPGGGKALGGTVMSREPIGVVSSITPYNAPFLLNIIKVAGALAAGNTTVLKPSPYTPLSALLVAECADEAGIPPGVLNVVTGDIAVGEQLTTDPRIDMVSFTGSDVVGAKVMAQASKTLKKVQLELGGKSVLIVRRDADLDLAVTLGMRGFTTSCGQGCSLTTRLLVHNAIRGEYVERLAAAVDAMVVGRADDPMTTMGPLIREVARARVEKYVQLGLAEKGRLVRGGKRPSGLERGFFYEPTFFDDIGNHTRIAQEEIFGPVGVVIGFDSDDDAVRIANDSRYGLGGGIVSRDAGTAFEMALRVRTGQVHLNGGLGGPPIHAPFGGFKQSGIGREWGEEGFKEFFQLKAVTFHAG